MRFALDLEGQGPDANAPNRRERRVIWLDLESLGWATDGLRRIPFNDKLAGMSLASSEPGPVAFTLAGKVASLHLHPNRSGGLMESAEAIRVVQGKGIEGNGRYFGRVNGLGPNDRQVSLIEREQISEHAAALGAESFRPGVVRSNIETLGVDLVELIGREIHIGEARLFLWGPRTPCAKMDAILPGLKTLMMGRKQGVLARVTGSGEIRVGDAIRVREAV